MTLWMLVTMDKYELPVYVADSAKELARFVGKKENCIHSAICHAKRRKSNKCRYVKVNVDDINE